MSSTQKQTTIGGITGYWRDEAPNLEQVEAHGGYWWRAGRKSQGVVPPAVDRLTTGQDPGDEPGTFRETHVWSDEEEWDASQWETGGCEDWRDGAWVCPCENDGTPVPWPDSMEETPHLHPPLTNCASDDDGDCIHAECPQLRDGEPKRSGRHCPLDHRTRDET